MLNIGPSELLVILLVALIVVGPRRLPSIGRSIGRAMHEFRRASEEARRSLQTGLEDLDRPTFPDAPPSSSGEPSGDGDHEPPVRGPD